MAEIILNPDVEIIHDDDRKLYWQLRLAMDTQFLMAIKQHVEKGDHCYHICFNQYLDVRQLSLKNFIDQHRMHNNVNEIIEQLVDSIGQELTEAMTNLVAVFREAERRGIKIK